MSSLRHLLRGVCCVLSAALVGCNPTPGAAPAESPNRIVSLSGTLSEIIVALGHEANLVGVDVTSTYPPSLARLPKVGHTRQLSVEGILSLQPRRVLAMCKDLSPTLSQQLSAAQVEVICFEQAYSIAGSQGLVQEVADALGSANKGDSIAAAIAMTCADAPRLSRPARILFIYARGAGTLMVAGQETPVDALIQLAGGRNAAQGFTDFQPLTAEALVQADPEIVLLFDSGLKSLGGPAGLMDLPGMAMTSAGRRQAFVAMDGLLLTGFGPRLAEALTQLTERATPFLQPVQP